MKMNTNSRLLQDAINRSNNSIIPPTVNQSMKAVTEEESYAKATTGPPIDDRGSTHNSIVKVLGSIWKTANDQFTFNLSDPSHEAKLLPTTK